MWKSSEKSARAVGAVTIAALLVAGACKSLVLPVGVDEAPVTDAGLDASGCREGCKDADDAPHDGTLLSDVDFGRVADGDSAVSLQQQACLQGSGWTWCNPQPTGVTLNAVWGSGPSDVWAVGAGGTTEHWNGTGWSIVPTPTTLELLGVWGSGAGDIWAVGSNAHGTGAETAASVILHGSGSAWTLAQTLPGTELWSVWGSGPSDVWFVGASDPGSGLFVHFDGSTWSRSASPQTSVLFGVAGSATNDIWAVGNLEVRPDASTGENDGTFTPEILRWDGLSWTLEYDNGGAASPSLPLAVWSISASDAWAATTGYPLHWNGIEWSSVTVPGTTVGPTAFGGTGSDDLWGTLGGAMAHWNGSSWDPEDVVTGIGSPGNQPLSLSSVWANATNDAWAVGEGGALVHFDGTTWSPQSLLPALLSAWAGAVDDAWAVGDLGTALHWNGSTWSSTNPGTTEAIRGVWGASTTDVWAVAEGSVLLRWNGSWRSVPAPTVDPLVALWGSSSTDVWVSNGPNDSNDAGASGGPSNTPQFYHWDGSGWQTSTLSAGSPPWIDAIWEAAANDAWAVGYQASTNPLATRSGAVAHWGGSAWTAQETPLASGSLIATEYTSVWGSSSNDVWVVGSAVGTTTAAVIHWDGTRWSDATMPNLTGTGGLWGSGARDAWLWAHFAGTLEESLLHWDGTTWSPSLTLPDVWSYGTGISGTGTTDLWVVGSGGLILHHR